MGLTRCYKTTVFYIYKSNRLILNLIEYMKLIWNTFSSANIKGVHNFLNHIVDRQLASICHGQSLAFIKFELLKFIRCKDMR